MPPCATITALCFSQVTRELNRVLPHEGILVPLVALSLADPGHNPCAAIHLDDIAEILIAAVVLVPHDKQVNHWARVSVLPHTDDTINADIEARVRLFPRLRAAAYLHSHPFAHGSTAPSHGTSCDYEGHMLPLLEANRMSGLLTSFSFIACRGPHGRGWRLQCFALNSRAEIVDVGFARVVPDGDPRVLAALTPAIPTRPVARAMLRHAHTELRRRGLTYTTDELFDGWRRTIIRLSRRLAAVVLVPVDYPTEAPRYFVVDRATGRTVTHTPRVSAFALAATLDEIREAHHEPP